MKHEYDLTSRPGSLALHGGPYGITQDECPTMLLQKQPSFDAVWRCTIDFDPKTRHEAGTALWWSKYAYASIGIRPSGDRKREVILRRPNPNDDTFLVGLLDKSWKTLTLGCRRTSIPSRLDPSPFRSLPRPLGIPSPTNRAQER